MKMRNLSLGIIGLIFLTSCVGNKEVEFPMDIKVDIKENQEDISELPIKLEIKPLYKENIKYKGTLPMKSYIFTNRQVNIRRTPSTKSSKITLTQPMLKMKLIKKVEGENLSGNSKWYRVEKNNQIGYIHSSVGVLREFKFDEMALQVRKLENFVKKTYEDGKTLEKVIAYIPGSSEKKGTPRDKYGNRGEQSILARYTKEGGGDSFRYLQDGRIISVDRRKLDSIDKIVKKRNPYKDIVKIPDSANEYKIDTNRTSKVFEDEDTMGEEVVKVVRIDGVTEYKLLADEEYKELREREKASKKIRNQDKSIDKMIVIDIKNQTQGAFEKNKESDIWELISYTMVTTGRDDKKDSYETPIGYYMVQNTVKQVIFPYKSKVITNIYNSEGEKTGENVDIIKKYSRANYGIRFSGGGYLHGIPMSDDLVKSLGNNEEVLARKKFNERKLGTYKASHKCVRSPEEYERFLYNEFVGYQKEYKNKWWRRPKDLVAVIVY